MRGNENGLELTVYHNTTEEVVWGYKVPRSLTYIHTVLSKYESPYSKEMSHKDSEIIVSSHV